MFVLLWDGISKSAARWWWVVTKVATRSSCSWHLKPWKISILEWWEKGTSFWLFYLYKLLRVKDLWSCTSHNVKIQPSLFWKFKIRIWNFRNMKINCEGFLFLSLLFTAKAIYNFEQIYLKYISRHYSTRKQKNLLSISVSRKQ